MVKNIRQLLTEIVDGLHDGRMPEEVMECLILVVCQGLGLAQK
jgi:hypothetical protein